MALYHKWDVKNGFAYVLTFFSLISDVLGSVPKILQDYVHIISTNCTLLRGATIFVYRPGMLLDVSEDTVCL